MIKTAFSFNNEKIMALFVRRYCLSIIKASTCCVQRNMELLQSRRNSIVTMSLVKYFSRFSFSCDTLCNKTTKNFWMSRLTYGLSWNSQIQHIRRFSSTSRSLKAIKIDGKAIALEINNEVKCEVEALKAAGKRVPHLAVLLVGNDPASLVYVKNKAKAAEYTGISCDILRIPKSVTEEELLKEIHFLNGLSENDGILIQLPLPSHINARTVCDAVLPRKDVDGFNVLNVGRFCVDQKAFIPATPSGVLEIIRRLKIETCGKNAVVCGRSKNVGLPIALHLHSDSSGGNSTGDATTTICHRNTPPDQLRFFTRAADILVTATGVPGLVTKDMVKDGVVVIDIGITRVISDSGRARLVGDVDYEGVSEKASYITPVPGGVGPVTVAMVIKNTLAAYKNEIDFGRSCTTLK